MAAGSGLTCHHDQVSDIILRVSTVLEPSGPATAIVLSDDQVAELGAGKTPAVVVTIGDRSARLRVGRMGGQNLIGLSKANRAVLGVEIGDRVTAEIGLDQAERTVDVPPALAAVLDADPMLRESFEGLSYTRRKEYAAAITGAKKPETVQRRLAGIAEDLRGTTA